MRKGNVIAIATARAKARTRQEWEKAVEGVWADAVRELRANAGFMGLLALWNNDDSRQASVIGVWDTMEHRMAYEARSSTYVRGLFNAIFEEVPQRPRWIITKARLQDKPTS